MSMLVMDDIISRSGSITGLSLGEAFANSSPVRNADDANAALALISEAGQAMRKLERDSKEAVGRAIEAAEAVQKKLDKEATRAENAENSLKRAIAEADELRSLMAQASQELELMRNQIAHLEGELTQTAKRAEFAERRVEDANNSIQKVIDAIRDELLIRPTV